MVKTAVIHDDVHELIVNKKNQLKEKYQVDIQITDIINNIIRKNIDKFDLKIQNESELSKDRDRTEIRIQEIQKKEI